MKKGIFLVLTIILSMFVLNGCYSNQHIPRKNLPSGRRSGYPAGHDLHPDTEYDSDGPSDGGFS